MKLLFDQNLSDSIPFQITDLFPESTHVTAIGLERGEDDSVAKWAIRNDYTIVSKDADFYQRSMVFGYPSKSVWLRVGDCSTDVVVDLLRSQSGVITEFGGSAAESVLILDKLGS